jgi:hypothetical protein
VGRAVKSLRFHFSFRFSGEGARRQNTTSSLVAHKISLMAISQELEKGSHFCT